MPDPAVDNPAPVPSPPGSFTGWSFKTWLQKNKGDLKLLVSAASGLGTAWVTAHVTGDWAPVLGGAVGFATKLLLDWIDFGLTANPS